MLAKIVAIVSLLALPASASLWLTSHKNPNHRRYDATLYKSLNVYLKDGICGLRLLSMPTKTASRSAFHGALNVDATPGNHALYFNTRKSGPYRITWLVFPLWISTLFLMVTGTVPLAVGPLRLWRRRRNGWCLECGYNLRGNRSGRCPECGTRFRHASAPARRRPGLA